MVMVTPLLRSPADATRRPERAHGAATVPLEQRPDSLAAHVGEGTRRERVRIELLVARARASR